MKINITWRDQIWNYLATALSLLNNFLMLPFVLHYLDRAMLGIWYIFQSLGSIAQLMDMGFNVSFARNIAYCWCGAKELTKEGNGLQSEQKHDDSIDFVMMKNVLTVCKKVYLIISTTAAALLLTAGTAYVFTLASNENCNVAVVIIAWSVYVLAIWMNLFYGYYVSFLRGVGQVADANKYTVAAKLTQLVVCVVLLVAGAGLLGVSLAYCLYGVLFRVLAKRGFYRYQNIGKRLAEVKTKPSKLGQKQLLFTIGHNAWRDGVVSISLYLSEQASTIVTSAFMDLAQTGIYSLGMQLAAAVAQIASAAYNAYQPTLQSAYIENDNDKMRKSMSVIIVSYVALFVLGYGGLVTVGVPLIKLVKPDSVVSFGVLTGLCVYQFMLKLRNCYASYFSCTNRLIYMNAYLVSSILGIVLSVVMLNLTGGNVWGMIAAMMLGQVYNVIKWPCKAHKEMKISFAEMVKLCMESVQEIVKAKKHK